MATLLGSRPGDETGPVCYVRHNGIGIEPRCHDDIFGLFQKLDPRNEGAGVGLAPVKRIIDVHGGWIWVESEGAARGSTFYLTLPPRSEPCGKSRAPDDAREHGRTAKEKACATAPPQTASQGAQAEQQLAVG